MNGTLTVASPPETVASPSETPGLTSLVPYRVRPATKDDLDAIRAFICGLSVQSQYFRFFTAVSPPSAGLLRALTGNERADVLLVTDESGAVIGHGMAVDAGSGRELSADIGLVVADNWQGKGVGTMLLALLTRRAAARGVATLVLDVLPDNARMLGIIERRWPNASRKRTLDAVVIHACIARSPADSQQCRGPGGPVQARPSRPVPGPEAYGGHRDSGRPAA